MINKFHFNHLDVRLVVLLNQLEGEELDIALNGLVGELPRYGQ